MHEDRHPPARSRRGVWAMLIAATLVLHAAVLGAVDGPALVPQADTAAGSGVILRAVDTRSILSAMPLPEPTEAPAGAQAATSAEPAPASVPRAARASSRVAATNGGPMPAPSSPSRRVKPRTLPTSLPPNVPTDLPSDVPTSPPSAALLPAKAEPAEQVQPAAPSSDGAGADAESASTWRLAQAADPASASPVPSAASMPAPAGPADAAAPAEPAIPHYRTRMPAAATMRYQLSRGMLHGTGELRWQPDGERYEARLEGKLGAMTLLTQVSSGGFDADGIAPVRFTDTRIRRSTVAANFQRDAGKVTFSGAEQALPLRRGVQDRVSWMVQLAAIVAAQPELRNPGAKIVMHIVGAHGDSSVWTFHCSGRETIETGIGPVATLKYARESEGTYETRAAAWLDAAHHYLPARATMRSGPNDDGYELLLEAVDGRP